MVMDMDIMVMDMEVIITDINKSSMKIKTYVINLKDSVDRREAVLAEIANHSILDIELVKAVDGRDMSSKEIKECFDVDKFINRYYRTPRGGEIGCTLSHRLCYRKLLESEEEFALILEDDVTFIYPADVENLLAKILYNYQDNKPYFITLAMHFLYYPKKYRQLGEYTFYKIYNAYGTCAYLINREGAKRLLSTPLPFTLADDYPFMRSKKVQLEGVYPTFAVGASTKNVITTEIQQMSVICHKKSFSQYLYKYYRALCLRLLLIPGKLSIRYNRYGVNE